MDNKDIIQQPGGPFGERGELAKEILTMFPEELMETAEGELADALKDLFRALHGLSGHAIEFKLKEASLEEKIAKVRKLFNEAETNRYRDFLALLDKIVAGK